MPEHPIFARLWDRIIAGPQKAGLDQKRAELLSRARGKTLDLGSGTGHNLPHFPEAVTELVLTEPDPHMAKRLRAQVERGPARPGQVQVIEAPAEELPFDDGHFDTVVATLVFCTVEDPQRAIAETRRVLADGGELLFIEHVRSESPGRARMQDLFERPWGWVGGGCHPNRATGETIAGAGFWIERMDRRPFEKAGPLVQPLIVGAARRPSSTAAPDY